MEAREFMELFDSYWFVTEIFKKQSKFSTLSAINQKPNPQIEGSAEKKELFRDSSSISRSMSDQLSSFGSGSEFSMSPDSVLPPAKLQTIFSGKEITDHEEETGNPANSAPIQIRPQNEKRGKSGGKKKLSKSLSELEFDELKGFMDLGFVFSDEDKNDSELVSIIPGLQRLGKKGSDSENDTETVARRPYLSEAWEVLDKKKKKKEAPLMNWRIPAVGNDIDMKESLRFWAHSVASVVR